MPTILCEICGKNPAVYVCGECGGRICRFCIDLNTLRCVKCGFEAKEEGMELYKSFRWITPSILFLLSFIIISIGVVFIALATIFSDKISGFGAILLIGPIPIILGSGPQMLPILIIGLVVTICATIMFFYLHKR